MLEKNVIVGSGFRTLDEAELDAVAGGNLHIDGKGVDPLTGVENPAPGFDLADYPGSTTNVYGPVLGDGGSSGSGGAGYGDNDTRDPDPSPVDLDNTLDGSPSSPPSLDPSQPTNDLPGVDVGGATVNGFTTGSPTNPNGGGVTITVPIG